MQIRTLALISTIFAAGMLAACGAGGSSGGGGPVITPPTNAPGGGPDPNGYMASSIGMINSIGAPLQENLSAGTGSPQVNTCRQIFNNTSVRVNQPDSNNDPSSSETIRYNGTTCDSTKVVSDTVHIWTPQGTGSESVQFTTTKWQSPSSLGSPATAVRTGTIVYTNAASFTTLGDPVFQTNSTRTETTKLTVNGTVVTQGANEWVDNGPDGSGNEKFCGDAVGYNAVPDSLLNEAFGWSEISSNGLRSPGSNGDTTFTTTRTGTAYVGPAGFMSISTGASANTSCPITAPLYTATLGGGYSTLNFNIPVSYTFNGGFLKNVTIQTTSIGNYTLTASTQTLPGTNQLGINGTIMTGNTKVATFLIDMNGFGTLTMATGSQTFAITDWHIIN